MRRSMRLCVTVLAVAIVAVSAPMGAVSAQAADPMVGAPTVGQCFNHDYAAMLQVTAPGGLVDCSQRHTAITVAVVPLPERLPVTGDTEKTLAYLGDQCESAWNAAFGVGHKLRHITAITRTLYLPPQDLVEQGARWGRCDVVSIVGKSLVPIGASTPLVKSSMPKGDLLRCLRKDFYVTSCSRAHAWEPARIATLRGSTFPSRTAQIRVATRNCGEATSPGHRWISWPISRSAWRYGERHFVCWESR